MDPPAPPQYNEFEGPVFLAYFDLYCRLRGLTAILVERGLVPAERFEDEGNVWVRENRRKLAMEARDHFRKRVILMSQPDPPSSPELPSA